MKQTHFEWVEPSEAEEPVRVVLSPETTDALIVLMARAMIAVVHAAAEEAADER